MWFWITCLGWCPGVDRGGNRPSSPASKGQHGAVWGHVRLGLWGPKGRLAPRTEVGRFQSQDRFLRGTQRQVGGSSKLSRTPWVLCLAVLAPLAPVGMYAGQLRESLPLSLHSLRGPGQGGYVRALDPSAQ